MNKRGRDDGEAMNLGTHAFVGSLPCGCGVTFASDMTSNGKWGTYVVSLLKAGYVVRWLPRYEAQALCNSHCADYPHEQWQKDYQHRLEAFAAGNAGNKIAPTRK